MIPGCTDGSAPPDRITEVELHTDSLIAQVDERFLCFAVDTAQVVGGTFWNPDGEPSTVMGDYRVDP